MSVRVCRLLPGGKRHIAFRAASLEMAWVYFVVDHLRKRDGRVWIDEDYRPGVVPRSQQPRREVPMDRDRPDDTQSTGTI